MQVWLRGCSLILCVLFFGCGSRKVNKSEFIQVIEQQSVKEVKSDLKLSVKDSFVSQFVNKNSRFKATEIKIDKDGGVVISNPIVEVVEESGSTAGVYDSIVKDKGLSKVAESVKTSSNNKDKNVDQEQYSWWGWLVPLGVLVGVGWLVLKKTRVI
ncbi:hypothetical protein HX049_08035 [Myroides odoratimimus]|uniref:hypothetical protein n=1 Tax=Myroides odoratimimus TaxID=76832 RepID=UPI002577EA3D|nr:hypothetical protein [Myroides odoratimimus]MDM1397123.1 hypothetical protein [Myroides odoratimimus]